MRKGINSSFVTFICMLVLVVFPPLIGFVNAFRDSGPVKVIRTLEGYVNKISDGDTFTLLTAEGVKLKVRTAFYDAPETPKYNHKTGKLTKPGQPLGAEATRALSDKIEGKAIRIDVIDIDRYKRLVGIVWLGERTVNIEMVREGWAQSYLQYLKDPYRNQFLEAEQLAKQERRGIWSISDYENPAEFRKRLRIAGE